VLLLRISGEVLIHPEIVRSSVITKSFMVQAEVNVIPGGARSMGVCWFLRPRPDLNLFPESQRVSPKTLRLELLILRQYSPLFHLNSFYVGHSCYLLANAATQSFRRQRCGPSRHPFTWSCEA